MFPPAILKRAHEALGAPPVRAELVVHINLGRQPHRRAYQVFAADHGDGAPCVTFILEGSYAEIQWTEDGIEHVHSFERARNGDWVETEPAA